MRVIRNPVLIKLCHARSGDVVRLRNLETGDIESDLLIVCVDGTSNERALRPGAPHGLYDEQRPLFLVDLATGKAQKMPHLSKRIEIVRNVAVVEDFSSEVTE